MKSFIAFSCLCLCWFSLPAQNRGLNFAAPDDFILIDNPAQTANFITVETWFNPSTSSQDRQDIIYQTGGRWRLSNVGGTWAAGTQVSILFYNEAFQDVTLVYTLPSSLAGSWHHLAFTYDGTALKLYLDGNLVAETPFTGTLNTTAGNQMGFGSGSYSYVGTLDEVRIWNVARTQAEIQGTMNKEIAPATTGLISYYQFNQGTVGGDNTAITTLTDAVTPSRNGTLYNFTLTGSTSNFVVGYPALIALPLKFLSFAADKRAGVVHLQWKTAMESSIHSFEIERSSDGRSFSTIGLVNAQPSAARESIYKFTDHQPDQDMNYYRLKANESLGKAGYSNVLLIRMDALNITRIYPNPANDVVQMQTAQKGKFTVLIRDVTQRVVKNLELSSVDGTMVTTIDVSNLSKGLYFIYVGKEVIRFSKQ